MKLMTQRGKSALTMGPANPQMRRHDRFVTHQFNTTTFKGGIQRQRIRCKWSNRTKGTQLHFTIDFFKVGASFSGVMQFFGRSK